MKLPVVKKLHGNFFKRHRSAKHEDVSKIFDRTQILRSKCFVKSRTGKGYVNERDVFV